HDERELWLREAVAEDGGPGGIELPAEHAGAGGEELGGQHSASRADLQDPLAFPRQKADQRPAEDAIPEMMLAQSLRQSRVLGGLAHAGNGIRGSSAPCQFGPHDRRDRRWRGVQRAPFSWGTEGYDPWHPPCSQGWPGESMELDVATLNRDVERET